MEDFILTYKPFGRGGEACCRVRIWELGGSALGTATIVVVSELSDNPGMSVTNAAEYIATQLVREAHIQPDRTIWIEHYSDRHPAGMEGDPMFDESFDLVTFEWNGGVATEPRWHRVSRRWAEELIGNGL